MRWISAARKIRELSANAAEEALDVDENKDGMGRLWGMRPSVCEHCKTHLVALIETSWQGA